ncbi:MAG: DUF11 domain-containing protein, partial [Micrococcales bacterium]|nr:DUF11 domain-containing protein [Micrococcales bacterium]
MPSSGTRAVGALLAAGLTLTGLAVAMQTQAAETVPFAPRFTANANGAIATIGNTLLICRPGTACTQGLDGQGSYVNNNDFEMLMLNADPAAPPSMKNSSSSRLTLPTGASVLWAGLYWGARITAGTNGNPSEGNRAQISFKPPGRAAYQTLTSTVHFGPNTGGGNAYQEFADVTSLVTTAGSGEYWVGDISAATGYDRYAGWALSVAYKAPSLPYRNLVIFDGFTSVSSGSPQTVTISGFRAPPAGQVDAELSIVAYEGDRGLTGDFARLNNAQLATGLTPNNNFFNCTNEVNGTNVTARTPAHVNMLGFDVKTVGTTNVIGNNATSATFTFGSSGDQYFPGVLATSINLYAPDFTASSKTAVNLDGNTPALPGDTIQYTVSYVNFGQDHADNSVSQDTIPDGVTYVPGSLKLADAASTPLTDAKDGDQGEVVGGVVTVRLGQGANGTRGGRIGIGERYGYTFQATVDTKAAGTTVKNYVNLTYTMATTGAPGDYGHGPAITDVGYLADVEITKTMSPLQAVAGQTVTATLTVRNHGPTAATGIVVTDTLPPGLIAESVVVSSGQACATPPAPSTPASSAIVRCGVGNLAVGGSASVTIVARIPATASAGMVTNVASVTSQSTDPNLANNLASASVETSRRADLAVTKTASPTAPTPGATVAYQIGVTNNGPSTAVDVILADIVPEASRAHLTLLGATPGAGVTCPPSITTASVALCTIPTLAVGATRTMTVQAQVHPATPQGTTIPNTATVTANTPDPNMS